MNRYNLSKEELRDLYVSGDTFESLAKRLGVKNRTHAFVFFNRKLKPGKRLKELRKRKKNLKRTQPIIFFRRRCRECGDWIRRKRRNARYCQRHGTNGARQKRFYWRDPVRYRFYQKLFRQHKVHWVKARIWNFIKWLTRWFKI